MCESLFFSLFPGGHLCSALPSVPHAVEHGAPSGCRRFHMVAKIVNWSKKKKKKALGTEVIQDVV